MGIPRASGQSLKDILALDFNLSRCHVTCEHLATQLKYGMIIIMERKLNDLRCHRVHYDVTVMMMILLSSSLLNKPMQGPYS